MHHEQGRCNICIALNVRMYLRNHGDDMGRVGGSERIDKITEYERHERLRQPVSDGTETPDDHQRDVVLVGEQKQFVKRNLLLILIINFGSSISFFHNETDLLDLFRFFWLVWWWSFISNKENGGDRSRLWGAIVVICADEIVVRKIRSLLVFWK